MTMATPPRPINFAVPGRMIADSKGGYRALHPTHRIVFNANLFSEQGNKLWWGDLDLTLDEAALQAYADTRGEMLYVLSEKDGRDPESVLLESAMLRLIPRDPP